MKIMANRCPLQSDILKSCRENNYKIIFISCDGESTCSVERKYVITSFFIGIVEDVADKYGNFTAKCIFPDDIAMIDFL